METSPKSHTHDVTPQNTLILIILPRNFKLHVRITCVFLLLQFYNFLFLTSRYSPIIFHGNSCYRSYGWERQCALYCYVWLWFKSAIYFFCGATKQYGTESHVFPSYDSNLYTVTPFAGGSAHRNASMNTPQNSQRTLGSKPLCRE
jgi:hypothetical protein